MEQTKNTKSVKNYLLVIINVYSLITELDEGGTFSLLVARGNLTFYVAVKV
ncbi:MAG: hypothetical protein HND52_14690 [Ignavibacteriae bacterium]|nr:hypothetical protein [Ignavibacteriota bacterium]